MSPTMIDCEAQYLSQVLDWFPDNPYAGYVTGGPPIEWSTRQFSLPLKKIRIAQQPGYAIDDGSPARVLDVERYAATPADWPLFYDSRTSRDQATCYNSLLTVPRVVTACESAQIRLPPRWWLAWYWNHPGAPSIGQVLAELYRLTSVSLDPATIWGIQYVTAGLFDKSIIYGIPDFARE